MGRNKLRIAAEKAPPVAIEKPEADTGEDESVSIEASDDIEVEPDEDDSEDETLEPTEQRAPRRQRRNERLQKLRAEDEEKNRQVREQSERERREAEARAAYWQGQAEARTQQQAPGDDPDEAEIKRAQRRKEELQDNFSRLSAEEQQAKYREMQDEWNLENRKEQAAIYRAEQRRDGMQRQQPNQMAGVQQYLIQKHASDILQAPRNVQEFGVLTLQRLHRAGYPDNEDTLVLAAQETRAAFPDLFPGQKRPAPKPRSTMLSVRSSGGPPVRENGERKTVKMNDALRKLARSAYPRLPPEQAYKKWASEHQKWREKNAEDEDVKRGG